MTKKNIQVNFGINDAPLWVFDGISSPAKERFNDVRWVRLAELLQKEQELETLRLQIYGGVEPAPEPVVAPVEEAKPEVVKKKSYLGKGE